MKKIFFILFIIFTVSSCTYENSSFRRISKEEAMQGWAWKIFIFTDEGEFQPAESEVNKNDKHIKENPIFVKDIWKMNSNEYHFFKNHQLAVKEEADNAILEQTKRNR